MMKEEYFDTSDIEKETDIVVGNRNAAKTYDYLEKSAKLMLSSDFKERFQAEYYQLIYRLDGIKSMISKYNSGELSFKPKSPIEIFERQAACMEDYKKCLEERAKLDNIEL